MCADVVSLVNKMQMGKNENILRGGRTSTWLEMAQFK